MTYSQHNDHPHISGIQPGMFTTALAVYMRNYSTDPDSLQHQSCNSAKKKLRKSDDRDMHTDSHLFPFYIKTTTLTGAAAHRITSQQLLANLHKKGCREIRRKERSQVSQVDGRNDVLRLCVKWKLVVQVF